MGCIFWRIPTHSLLKNLYIIAVNLETPFFLVVFCQSEIDNHGWGCDSSDQVLAFQE
jgi:hypothetical protein